MDLMVVPSGTITAEKYILETWAQCMVPFYPYIDGNFASPHVTQMVRNHLDVEITT